MVLRRLRLHHLLPVTLQPLQIEISVHTISWHGYKLQAAPCITYGGLVSSYHQGV